MHFFYHEMDFILNLHFWCFSMNFFIMIQLKFVAIQTLIFSIEKTWISFFFVLIQGKCVKLNNMIIFKSILLVKITQSHPNNSIFIDTGSWCFWQFLHNQCFWSWTNNSSSIMSRYFLSTHTSSSNCHWITIFITTVWHGNWKE